ncbi:MAG: entericidin A/B family lipoprotein [Rhodospirillaceae bacterium]|nr:entericidin A/B family lipoprotein [Rhodospirillaceae bacterium]
MTKLISAALAAGIALAALSACNTVEGVGKDIKSAGKTVEKVGKDSK